MPPLPLKLLIQQITPRNFLSFAPDNSGIELGPLNLLIGPNGSGKSNLIEAIHFMRGSMYEWRDILRRGGGVAEWPWKGSGDAIASVEWVVQQRPRGTDPMPLRHGVAFRPVQQSFEVEKEMIENLHKRRGEKRAVQFYESSRGEARALKTTLPRRIRLALGSLDLQRSVVNQRNDPEIYPEIAWLASNYKKIRIYREWSFGIGSPLRYPQPADLRNDMLEEDFSNLGLRLSKLRRSSRAKQQIIENLRKLYAGLTDFDVAVEGGTVQVFFMEGEFVIPATRLSDGTLRFLCLLAILCDPEPPRLICIEEPELGLHPDILPTVADLLRSAAERTQLVVTTHSEILVDAMTDTPECVVVCEKHEGATRMTRLSADELAVWLEKYRLGQLWIDGQLGGKRW